MSGENSVYNQELIGYYNSTPVFNFGGEPMYISDIVKACLLSKSNLLLLGKTGDGKTTLANSVGKTFFNNEFTNMRMNKEFNIKDAYEEVTPKKTSLISLNDKTVKNKLIFIDEFNRAPAVIQNDLFNILDGYYNFKGEKAILGNGYSVVIAAANPSDTGEYIGTFESDDALINRFTIVLNMDDYPVTPKDTTKILLKRINGEKSDLSDKILNEWEKIKAISESEKYQEGTLSELTILQYLIHGLKACESKGCDKSLVKLSECNGCHELGSYCRISNPMNLRIKKAYQDLFPAFIKIYEEKTGSKYKLGTDNALTDFFELIKLMAPYSGLINKDAIQSRINDLKEKPSDYVINAIKNEFIEKMPLINKAWQDKDFSELPKKFSFMKELF